MMRKTLGFTQITCAEFLGVDRDTIRRWEAGKPVAPRAAVYALSLLSGSSLSLTNAHRDWRGWFVGHDGRLYTPDGCYWFTADKLRAWWIESQIALSAKQRARELEAALAAATKENIELRILFVNAGVIDELDAMQKRVGELVAQLNTARLLPFPSQSVKTRKVAA